ncbi:MAG TPA: recombinase family protein [Solirubrobacteraceae bacterium]|nr:recombinase family protein [Solirubrobacteraceae bacterium]
MAHIQSYQSNCDAEAVDAAAIYVRVSSTGQLGRDGDEDGYSIPAQVKACEAEAASRGAKVAKVYVERAESAKSDDRPVLQYMLKELPALGVKYLIVHKVDRLARNRLDDATLYQRFVGMGVKLVSVSENIDETPAGRLMHGMLASFAEYYSNNLANEIKKGLRQKHENGGTPFRPPIGYLSKRELVGGRDIRSVIVDPGRAPLIKMAFNLYSTGQWTLLKLADHLEEQGLRYPATARYPERPVAHNRLNEILRNPYYRGIVVWDGRRYPGRHEPLIDADTFDRVQMLLSAARIAGDRPQIHEHYLRATVVCDRCKGRLLYGRHRSRSGAYYEYFSCTNRAARRRKCRCQSGHYSVPVVEQKIEALYTTLKISRATQEAIRTELRQELSNRAALVEREAERHERTMKRIEAKQEKLLDLYYRDLVSEDIFERQQASLTKERRAAERLRKAAQIETQDLERALDQALARATDPHGVYLDATPLERRTMNKAIFLRIEIGEDGEITSAAPTPVYAALRAWQPSLGRPTAPNTTPSGDGPCSPYVRPSTGGVHRRIACKWASLSDEIRRRTRPKRAGIEICAHSTGMADRRELVPTSSESEWTAGPDGNERIRQESRAGEGSGAVEAAKESRGR